jgi:hypothetical protein
MKRINPIILVFIISFLPLSFSLGQEKKTEQKVKVVVADKSGTKVVIDTTFTGTGTLDSVILKGGKVIYIGENDSESDGRPDKHIKVIAHVGNDGANTGHQYVYINDDKVIPRGGDKKIDVMVSDDEFDNDLDITKYVIAKNGITVSIEGNDEVKVKELAVEIEKRLDINKEESGSPVNKVEKKIIKKN